MPTEPVLEACPVQLFLKTSLRLFLLTSLGFLAGCFPAPMGKYYKPIYPDASAKYIGDECYGQAGAPASLSFVIADGVAISITTIRTYGEKNRKDRPLRISIAVPSGTQMQFLSEEIRVGKSVLDQGKSVATEMDIAATVLMASNEIADFSKISPTPFLAVESKASVGKFSAATWLNFSWKDNFVPMAFSMEIPPIVLVDADQVEHLPIVLLAKAKKRLDRYPGENKSQTSLIYVTNASESDLAERYAQCVNQKPGAQCGNILIYDEGGFKIEKNGFKYSGRWYVHDVERRTPFSGDLKIEFGAPLKWRFASNKVRIVDALSAEERIYQFDSFPLRFSYQVPINTPVRGVSTLSDGKVTTLNIQSSLGTEELPRYFVKIPSVRINGRLHEIAPIELEKRVFDFGLEPFNC